MASKNSATFFLNPLLRHGRSFTFENFSNDGQKVDKYSDV